MGRQFCVAMVAVGLAAHWSAAAEIHFRAECKVTGTLVLLGDVAEIYDANPAVVNSLAKIDLVPAPPVKEKRTLRAREIQDLLNLRGVKATEHRFTGSAQVTVLGAASGAGPATAAKPPGRFALPIQQVQANVRGALLDYLAERTGGQVEWEVKFELKNDQAQLLSQADKSLKVEGGSSPWTGLQNLTLSYRTHEDMVQRPLTVQVTAPATVVVAMQNIRRGAIVRAGDVRLQAGKPVEGATYVLRAIEEVVGKEASRPIVEGQILDDQLLRRPVFVQRSDIVTVYAHSSGLRVRTTARAMDAGSEGDLVRVEAIGDRKSYFARVTGPQEVEVYAHAPTAVSDVPASQKIVPTGTAEPPVRQANYQERLPKPPLPANPEPIQRK